jgi:hypothetical protein
MKDEDGVDRRSLWPELLWSLALVAGVLGYLLLLAGFSGAAFGR